MNLRTKMVALPNMAALGLVLALTGCGGGSGGGSGGSAGAPTPTPPPAPAPAPAPAPSPTPTPPPPVASQLTQADARIGACMNMANHLEGNPTEGSWGRAINDTDFTDIAAVGFETIRLPVRWSNKTGGAPDYTIDPAWMNRVEQVVNQARAAGLRVILDDHHFDAIFTDPDGEKARFVAIWKQVAERFKDADDKVWFELMNEPHDQITDANLLSILEPALAEVRATNPTRPVVIGGQNFSGINSLATLPLPNDAYLMPTFHFYDPFNFTHQGAPFLNNPPPVGATYGSAADQQELANAVQKAKDFMTATGRPLFLGEYGAYQDIPMAERVKYYRAVRDAFHDADIDGCVWGYTATFEFRAANGTWNDQLLEAIGL